MKIIIFLITLFSGFLLIGSRLITLIKPKYRMWPLEKMSWKVLFVWILLSLFSIGIFLTAILDWDSFIFSHFLHYPIGVILMILGSFIALWGVKILGTSPFPNPKTNLITYGPYKYTRNPQLNGDIILIIGVIIFSNSFLIFLVGLLAILFFILTILVEEKYLKEKFGEEYIKYCKKVPRFF